MRHLNRGRDALTVALVAACALGRFARAESVGPLIREASARGLGELKVFQLHTVERTAEFYAAGRIMYDEQGEPVKFEGVSQTVAAIRAAGGRALVLVPPEHIHQLTDEPGVEAIVVGDNGHAALVFVRMKK